MEMISLKKEDAVKQWQGYGDTLMKQQSRNDARQTANVRTSFAVAAMGVGIMALSPALTLPFALMSGGLTLTGLTGAFFFYGHHAKTNARLKIEIDYCKLKELELSNNTRAKKGDVPINTDHVTQLVISHYEDQGRDYERLIRGKAFKGQDIKMMFGLITGTVMASLVGLGLLYDREKDNGAPDVRGARQEDVETNPVQEQKSRSLP